MFNSIFYKFKELFPKKDCKFTKNVKKLNFLILFLFRIITKQFSFKKNVCKYKLLLFDCDCFLYFFFDRKIFVILDIFTKKNNETNS